MEIRSYVDDLQRRLAAAAEMGGDDARELAERLAAPLDAAVRLVLLEALSAAAGEISAELAPGSVDVRLRGGDPEFVVSSPVTAVAPTAVTGTTAPVNPGQAIRSTVRSAVTAAVDVADGEEGATTRTTLRLPDHLKTRVETAAARDGVSVNTWLVRAVAAALEPSAAPTQSRDARGNRFTGWVR